MGFQPFTPMHALCVAVCAAVIVVVCTVGRRARGTPREPSLRRSLGWIALLYFFGVQGLWLSPRHFELDSSLPLHVCDLATLAAALAFLTDKRFVRTLLYFWGIALSTQGFVTPILTEGPRSPFFWTFWASHTINVGYAVFDLVASDYRPHRRDLVTAIAVTGAYFLFTAGLNAITGWNYAYTGPAQPYQPTLVDVLGPYPWRLVPIALIGAGAFVLVWLPWAIVARGARRRAS